MDSTATPPSGAPTIIPRAEHNISRGRISENALKVLYRLKGAGYAAFLVGGGVRDLLLNLHPKDFDVVTDAHPEEVKQLFRNCRLIGRRFRLAHVRFGRDIVEVATFRGIANGEGDDREHSDSGRILRDNVYGAIDEDIWRRDFTVNALYYNIADFSVVDYTTGMADVRSRTLRLIGDPPQRYREDPVRMLRAVRLAAKLDFTIAPETGTPIAELGGLLAEVPPARLFDEILKLFQAGHAVKSFDLLQHYDLFRYLFPATAELLAGPEGPAAAAFIREGLRNTDERVLAGKPVTPMFLFAILLWPVIKQRAEAIEAGGEAPGRALSIAAAEAVSAQQSYTSLPRRFSVPMVDMLVMQPKFLSQQGARARRLVEHKLFRAAYDFLALRGRCGEVDPALVDWWTRVQSMPPEEQREAFGPQRRKRGGRRRRGRRGGQAREAAQ